MDEDKAVKRLTSIFYNLLRDHVRPADIEKILQDDERHMWNRSITEDRQDLADAEVDYSNPYLRDYAKDIAGRVFGWGTQVKRQTSKPRQL